MGKILFDDKVKVKDIPVAEINKFTDANANEIKTVVNGLDDSIISNTAEIEVLKSATGQEVNELIEKGFNHVINFDWFVFAQVYRFNGVLTDNLVTDTITLDPSPTTTDYKRFDVIVFNDDFTFSVVKGAEGLNPAIPKINILTQIQLTVILVEANTTAPSYVTKQTMYDEGVGLPTEFTATKTGTGITIGSTEQSSSGTKSIKVVNPNTSYVIFLDKGTTYNSLDIDTVTFKIKNINAGNWRFYLYSYNSIDSFYQGTALIRNGRYGYNSYNITDWQTIIVPITAILGSGEVHNTGFALTFASAAATFYFDQFALNGNFTQAPTINTGISEAPIDNKYYLRHNGDWSDLDLLALTAVTPTNKILTEADANISGGSLEYQTENTNATTVLTTQKGLTKVYPFNKTTAQTVQVNTGVYVANDVVNLERRGQGTVEIIKGTGVSLKGVRDIDNRFFINDPNSIVALLCRDTNNFTILGNLKRGYTGIITTSFYSSLVDGDVNVPITVLGTGFSANMKDPVITGNATLVSWVFVNYSQITLYLTETGIAGDNITVTYDNGDVFVDTNALTILTAAPVYDTADLRHYYRLENDANDYKSTLNGTATNIVFSGTEADFNGTTAYIDLPDSDTLSYGNGTLDQDMSISFMVKFDSLTAPINIVSKMISAANSEYRVTINTATELILQTRDVSVPATIQGRFDPFNFIVGTQYHVVITKSGATVEMYVDNILKSVVSSTTGAYIAMENSTGIVRIGAIPYDATAKLNGTMKRLGFWNKKLTATEIDGIYTNEVSNNLNLI